MEIKSKQTICNNLFLWFFVNIQVPYCGMQDCNCTCIVWQCLVFICTYILEQQNCKKPQRWPFLPLVYVCSTTPKVRSSSGGDTSIHLASLLRGEFNSVDFWAVSNEEVTFLDVFLTRYVTFHCVKSRCFTSFYNLKYKSYTWSETSKNYHLVLEEFWWF